MKIRLSDKDASILLGATLMHWGVPFRRSVKHELSEHQQAVVDEASDKLISLRESCQRTQLNEAQEVGLSSEEAALLIAVVEDCLNECGSDATELSLQLKTNERRDVDSLLDRMRASLGSQFAKLG